LLWVALPQVIIAPTVAVFLKRVDGRIAIVAGLATICVACLIASKLSPDWAEPDFILPLLIQAIGQTLALTALVFFLTRHLTIPDALIFGALFQTSRLFGGELGTAALTVFTRKSEQVHSYLLGLHVGASDPATLDRLRTYAGGLARTTGAEPAASQAVGVIAGAVRIQAFTLAYADGSYYRRGRALRNCSCDSDATCARTLLDHNAVCPRHPTKCQGCNSCDVTSSERNQSAPRSIDCVHASFSIDAKTRFRRNCVKFIPLNFEEHRSRSTKGTLFRDPIFERSSIMRPQTF